MDDTVLIELERQAILLEQLLADNLKLQKEILEQKRARLISAGQTHELIRKPVLLTPRGRPRIVRRQSA